MGLIFIANIIIINLAKKVNIIFIIPDIVLQTYAYFINAIYIIFHNKARKVFKLGNFTEFV